MNCEFLCDPFWQIRSYKKQTLELLLNTKRVIGMGKVLAILFALKYCGENIRNATMPDT